jgi:predicted transcriptional regulator
MNDIQFSILKIVAQICGSQLYIALVVYLLGGNINYKILIMWTICLLKIDLLITNKKSNQNERNI